MSYRRTMSMSKQFDAIIIGGGHNGLVCAAYLGKAGRSVLVLEAAEQLGGLGATREFAPGFRASVAHTLPQLTARLVRELELQRHGFRLATGTLPTIALGESGQHLRITAGHVSGVSGEDLRAYHDYRQRMQKFADAITPFWHKRPPVVAGGSRGDLGTLAQFG